MARSQLVFACSACGGETLKWQGQCPHCAQWNSLAPEAAARGATGAGSGAAAGAAAKPRRLEAVSHGTPEDTRFATGESELDRVLGGGLVPGSVTLLGGDPGIGKSTLLLQVAAAVSRAGPVLYASGEESAAQVALRAARLQLAPADLETVAETDLDSILALARAAKAVLLVVDSIQTAQIATLGTGAGAVTQLRECTAQLVRFAKDSDTAVMIIGHVTKEGAIAGPRVLEHLVDTVLYFESDSGSRYRSVRATKNRFGPVGDLAFFLMAATGLREVRNPAAIFLARAPQPAPGSIVMVAREGGRPLLVELQGLVDRMRFGAPRRIAQGLDANRLAMLLAVVNRHAGVSLQEHDVFANVVGGLEIADTGWDLPALLALVSSLENRPLDPGLVAFGEVGLTGEVRPVAFGEERLREARKQGFRTAIVPRDNAPRTALEGLSVQPVARVSEAIEAAFRASPAPAPS
jgi:DNA repair protein RadA/Sms